MTAPALRSPSRPRLGLHHLPLFAAVWKLPVDYGSGRGSLLLLCVVVFWTLLRHSRCITDPQRGAVKEGWRGECVEARG